MTAQDLPAAAALSREVGWPHRLEDWQFVHAVGHGLVACADDRLIGTAMWWPYSHNITRLGMVIVDPTIQRAGVGRVLMQEILDQVGDSTVLLNATKQGETLYRRLSFREIGSIVQHQGLPVLSRNTPSGDRIRRLRKNDYAGLVEIDAAAGGAFRRGVVATLIDHGEAIALDTGGEIVGFACCRRFGRGFAIGPVVARDAEDAKELIAHFLDAGAGKFLRIDVPGDAGLSDWLDQSELARVDTGTTMVRGAPPQSDGRFHVFGLINQALG